MPTRPASPQPVERTLLPPGAGERVHCHLIVSVDSFIPVGAHAARGACKVSFSWWGDRGVLYSGNVDAGASWRFGVVCGPRKLSAYLDDAGVLRFDVGTAGSPGALLGSAQVRHLASVVEQRALFIRAGVYDADRQVIGSLLLRFYIASDSFVVPPAPRHSAD